jgi:hypothetical protein
LQWQTRFFKSQGAESERLLQGPLHLFGKLLVLPESSEADKFIAHFCNLESSTD